MPQLHMSASNWKSDIGLSNLNNLQRNAAHDSRFQLSQMYRPASVHEGKIAQYKEWYWEFLKHFTDLSWLILGCFFLRLFWWHFCSAGQRQQGVTEETA